MSVLKFTLTFQKRVRLAQGLWLLSWIAVLSGVMVFSMGVFLKTELMRRAEVMYTHDIHIVPNLLIVVGLASVGINLWAGRICQDSMDLERFARWKTIFVPYFSGSLFITSMLLVAMALSYILQPNLEESLKVGLKNGIRFYKDTDTPGRCYQKQTIDRLQLEFKCCGNNNFKDWFEVQWINSRYLDFNDPDIRDRIHSNIDGRFLMDAVPFSCCNPGSPRPCIQDNLRDNMAHINYDYHNEKLNLFRQGCREALVSYYMGLMNTIGPGVLSVFMLQMSVLLSLRFLQTSMMSVEDEESMELDTEGYLLEKSLKETFEDMLQILKKKLKLPTAQVEEDTTSAGGEEATEGEASS
ncbi:rod outer segment membrane protein 1b [Engraulis encrasicolus]|uniref:rod outer segment membrane protein 1b n=1 Tax=Engraulis encrasicolus TaxID=184585 RepID=UPI002FD25788